MKQSVLPVVLFLAWAILPRPVPGAVGAEGIPRGAIVDRLACRTDPSETYALYLPSGYASGRPWPVLYAFDPGGTGRLPIERFREAAEKFGYIIIGPNGSKNGPWEPIFRAMSAVWNDTQARFSLDAGRVYAAGFSGGARAAALFAAIVGEPAAGIIGCGAGLPEGVGLDRIPIPAYYGIAGIEDFNFLEMKELGKDLERARIPHWIETFDGGHEWPPASVCEGALEWMDLRAMKKIPSLRDESRISALLSGLWTAAASFEAAGDIPRAVERCRKAISLFDGLKDTGEIEGKAAVLEKSDAFRRFTKEEVERDRKEMSLNRGFLAILNAIEQSDLPGREVGLLDLDIRRMEKEIDAAKNTDPRDRALGIRGLLGLSIQARDRGRAALEEKSFREAVAFFDVASRAARFDPSRYRMRLYDLACAQALSGSAGAALRTLRLAVDNGFRDRDALLGDPDFDSLRSMQEFQDILRDMGNGPRRESENI
jgi:hypothetical protein